jgi:virginiamycin B lyase
VNSNATPQRTPSAAGRALRVTLLALACALLPASPAGAAEATSFTSLGPHVHAFSILSAEDGALWFGGSSSVDSHGVVGRLSASGELAEFELPADRTGPVWSMASGPEGKLWFTVPSLPALGFLTPPDGAIALLPLPEGHAANAIAAGPDGGLWLTELNAGRIARFDPASGELREFPLAPRSRPAAIAAGPDGALWFTLRRADRIGRIATSGQITRFELPGARNMPTQIVASGPYLWFTESTGHRLGRIGTEGELTQVQLPIRLPTSVLGAAPDGGVWYGAGPEIGYVSSSGAVSQPACLKPTCALPPSAIAAGPEGDPWFATGSESCGGYCGGGSELLLMNAAGFLGRFVAPPFSVALGPRAGAVRHRRTDIRLACGEPAGCEGLLRISVAIPGYPRSDGKPGRPRRVLRVGEASYSLAPGEGRRIGVRLRPRALRALPKSGFYATVAAGPRGPAPVVSERIFLRLRNPSRKGS